MLTEAGVPALERHDAPSELLQPLVPRYEEALSQLERAVQVRPRRGWKRPRLLAVGLGRSAGPGGPSASSWLRAGDPGPGVEVQGPGGVLGAGLGRTLGRGLELSCFLSSPRKNGGRRQPRPASEDEGTAPGGQASGRSSKAQLLSTRPASTHPRSPLPLERRFGRARTDRRPPSCWQRVRTAACLPPPCAPILRWGRAPSLTTSPATTPRAE